MEWASACLVATVLCVVGEKEVTEAPSSSPLVLLSMLSHCFQESFSFVTCLPVGMSWGERAAGSWACMCVLERGIPVWLPIWPYRYVNSYATCCLVWTGLDFSNYGCLSSGAYPTGVLVFTSKYPELECCSASQTTKDVLSFSSISRDHKTTTHYIPIYLFLLLRICLWLD